MIPLNKRGNFKIPQLEESNSFFGIVHHKEPLKSFEIRVAHSPGFGRPSVAILPKCAKSDVKQYTITFTPQPCLNAPIHGNGFGQIRFFYISTHVLLLYRMIQIHMAILRHSESLSLGENELCHMKILREKWKYVATIQTLLGLPYPWIKWHTWYKTNYTNLCICNEHQCINIILQFKKRK